VKKVLLLLAVFVAVLLIVVGQAKAHTWTPTTIRIVQVKDFGTGADFDVALEVWINPVPSAAGDLTVTSTRCNTAAATALELDGCVGEAGDFHRYRFGAMNGAELDVRDAKGVGDVHRVRFYHPLWPISQRVEYSIAIGVESDRYVYMTSREDVAAWCVRYNVCVDTLGYDNTDVSVNGLDVVVQPEPGVTLAVERYQAGDGGSSGGSGSGSTGITGIQYLIGTVVIVVLVTHIADGGLGRSAGGESGVGRRESGVGRRKVVVCEECGHKNY